MSSPIPYRWHFGRRPFVRSGGTIIGQTGPMATHSKDDPMSVPLLSLVADEYVGEGSAELADVVADLAEPSCGMSTVDRLTRWVGHSDDYASDEQGAAASVVVLTDSERVLYVIAGALDWQQARDTDARMLPRLMVMVSADDLPAPWSFVRSDDCGFWDATSCDTEDEARALLAEWERVNVSPVCDDCDEPFGADDGERSELGTFCPDCWRTRGEEGCSTAVLPSLHRPIPRTSGR